MFRTGAQLSIITFIVGIFLAREVSREPVSQWDESFADFLAMNAQRHEPAAQTTLVRIDDASLKDHPWPWSPVDFALFFQSANGFSPEVLATDEMLSWERGDLRPEVQGKLTQYQQILREHVLKASRVLLGTTLGFPEDPAKLPELEPTPVIRKVTGDVARVPEYTIIEEKPAEEYRLSSTLGFTNLPGTSQWHRSAPLVFRYRGQVVPSFVLSAVLLWEKAAIDDVSVELGSHITIGDRVTIPIDATGAMRVDFGAERAQCTLDDLVLAAEQRDAGSEPRIAASTFTGKFLMLSRTDKEVKNLKLACGRPGSRGELFASALATVQGRSFIKRAPWWSDLVIAGCFALLAYWVPKWSKGLTFFLCLVAVPAYGLIALGVFGSTLTWLSGVVPAGLLLFILLYRLVSPNIDPWAVERKG